jgi:parvulin-like peptidyl-prolyl isomerase
MLKFFSLSLIILVWGCKETKIPPNDIVAQINDRYLSKKELNYHVPSGFSDDIVLSIKKNQINKWIEDEIFLISAEEVGISLDDKEEFLVEEYRKSMLIQKYLNHKLTRNILVSEKEIDNYYNTHQKEFVRNNNEVHLIHFLLPQKDNAIFAEIKKCDDLMPLIKKYFLDQKSTIEMPNGDLGYIAEKDLPNKFLTVLKSMKTGDVSKPIRMDGEYHFIQLVDRKKAGTYRDLQLIRNDIVLRLRKEHRTEELVRLKRELKVKFQVQTFLSKIQ